MGTMLQRAGLEAGSSAELLNLVEPEMITGIHSNYYMVGADVAISNTFSGTRTKLAEFGLEDQLVEINRAGVRLARAGNAPHVLGDIGPTGLVMEPTGPATFEELYEIFKEQAKALALENPDAFLLETFTDIAELRCAILACKESCPDIPVIASASFAANGRMELSGTSPRAAAVIMEAAGADAVGMNCGLGPEQMLPLVDEMLDATTLPMIVQPNAGLPEFNPVTGKTVFPGTPEEMAAFARECYERGVAAVGSCCGSGPAHTGAIAAELSGLYVKGRAGRGFETLVLASPRDITELGAGPLKSIGERINPTGKPALRESLINGSFGVARNFASEQQEAGADLIDVNVGAPGVDAKTTLPALVKTLAGLVDAPLVIDTTDFEAMENALRIYPGKALINSVNGEEASLEAVLPLAKKYGAALVVLALDDDGIPDTAQKRVEIVERIAEKAAALGIKKQDLLVDSLVMAAAADPFAPDVTLAATKAVHERGFYTLLGVSNVSHGLPMRATLNAAFLDAAAAVGLDGAIINPNDEIMTQSLDNINQARESGDLSKLNIAADVFSQLLNEALKKGREGVVDEVATKEEESDPVLLLKRSVKRGDGETAEQLVDTLINDGTEVADLIADILTPTINEVGDGFARGELFLPQLMVAADAMKKAVAQAKTHLSQEEAGALSKAKIAFATVKGDIHSIGKDICISLLESQGFLVDNMGVDVSPERVLEIAPEVDGICLSALMTTTLPAMEETRKLIAAHFPDKPVFVGGAVVTKDWAESIDAVYSKDAPECVAKVTKTLGLS